MIHEGLRRKKKSRPYVCIFVCVNYLYLAHDVASVWCRASANKRNAPSADYFFQRISEEFLSEQISIQDCFDVGNELYALLGKTRADWRVFPKQQCFCVEVQR